MFEVLKTITDAEMEARKIVETATVQAEKIKQEVRERLAEIYNEAYEEATAEAKIRSLDLKKKLMEDAKREAEGVLRDAEKQINEIQVKARENFNEVIDAIVGEITS